MPEADVETAANISHHDISRGVQGTGLFVGLEPVVDRRMRTPAGDRVYRQRPAGAADAAEPPRRSPCREHHLSLGCHPMVSDIGNHLELRDLEIGMTWKSHLVPECARLIETGKVDLHMLGISGQQGGMSPRIAVPNQQVADRVSTTQPPVS